MRSFTLMIILIISLLTCLSANGQGQLSRLEITVDMFAQAWNSHDISGFGRIFAEDADWVTATGVKVKGRKEIQSALASEHSTWAKTSSMSITSSSVRRTGQNDAVLYFDWKITGAIDRDGKPTTPSHGVSLLVVTRKSAGWQIAAGQVTRRSTAAVAQPEARISDRDQITAVIAALNETWNKHDMRAHAELFHEDGVWIAWTGEPLIGAATFEANLTALHKTIFKNSVHKSWVEELTFVGPDAAIVREHGTAVGNEPTPEKILRYRNLIVVTKRNGVWKLSWGQKTRLADTAPG